MITEGVDGDISRAKPGCKHRLYPSQLVIIHFAGLADRARRNIDPSQLANRNRYNPPKGGSFFWRSIKSVFFVIGSFSKSLIFWMSMGFNPTESNLFFDGRGVLVSILDDPLQVGMEILDPFSAVHGFEIPFKKTRNPVYLSSLGISVFPYPLVRRWGGTGGSDEPSDFFHCSGKLPSKGTKISPWSLEKTAIPSVT